MKLKLFPLRLVAYPSKIVPLHIFEDRYKLLINECISTNSEFGIIYQNDKMLANVGCTVKVHKVLKRYKDGRMDILTKGNSPLATFIILGNKLLALPLLSSPIIPLGCAPTGLKYLRFAILQIL